MSDDKPHIHNHAVTEISSPIGVTSDGTGAVYAVQDQHFCSCGDVYFVNKGTKEVR